MAKKTIGELTIKDRLYTVNGSSCEVRCITLISQTEIKLGYDVFKMTSEDHTRFNFEVGSTKFYTEKIDALKELRERLDRRMEDAFKKQEDFLALIRDINNKIRSTDNAITLEEKSK